MTMLHIYEAIINQLEEVLTNNKINIKILNSHLSDSISRPSLRLEITSNTKQSNSAYREKNTVANIYYYAALGQEYQVDNMRMGEIIERTFSKYVKIDCNYVPVSSIKFYVKDNALISKIKFNYLEKMVDDIGDSDDIIESLNISNKLN